MIRVLAVNNYPNVDRFERLVNSLSETGATISTINWRNSSRKIFDSFDGVVLSGSPDMVSEERVPIKFSVEVEAMTEAKVPVLGICFGHQLIAKAFGSVVHRDKASVLKFVKTEVLEPGGIFSGLPRSLTLLESRHEVVKSLPEGFELLASSETSEIAAMKHKARPLYGIQSHPERYSKENPQGGDVLRNFVSTLS